MAEQMSKLVKIPNMFMQLLNEYYKGHSTFLGGNLSAAMPVVPLPPRQPINQSPRHVYAIRQTELDGLVRIPDHSGEDVIYILRRTSQIVASDRERVERLAVTLKFGTWIREVASQVLLVYGDFGDPWRNDVSALSLFVAMLAGSMASHNTKLFRPLVFFCGRHLNQTTEPTGGQAIVSSLVKQLLWQQIVDTRGLQFDISTRKICEGELSELCLLFSWLARRVPPDVTVFCLVDGLVFYERPEYADSAAFVLHHLLEMTRDTSISCIVKLLFTNPAPTTQLRNHPAFRNGENLINLAAVSLLNQGPSPQRFARELGNMMEGTSSPSFSQPSPND